MVKFPFEPSGPLVLISSFCSMKQLKVEVNHSLLHLVGER